MSDKPKFFLVEDDADHATLAVRQLRAVARDADVAVYDNVHSVWAALCDHARALPLVIFVDVHLGRDNGLDLVARMKASPRLRTIPAVILSAADDDETRTDALLCRADAYMTKPMSAARLEAMFKNGNFVWDIADLPKSLDRYHRFLRSQRAAIAGRVPSGQFDIPAPPRGPLRPQ